MDILTEKESEQMQRKSLRERENRQKNQCQRGEMKVQTRMVDFWVILKIRCKSIPSLPIGLHRKEADKMRHQLPNTYTPFSPITHLVASTGAVRKAESRVVFIFVPRCSETLDEGTLPKK